jgi:hypothetical protein
MRVTSERRGVSSVERFAEVRPELPRRARAEACSALEAVTAGASLSVKQREAPANVFVRRREAAGAPFAAGGGRPVLVFACDERLASVEAARANVQEVVPAVAPALDRRAREPGFPAGEPGEAARLVAGAKVAHERR